MCPITLTIVGSSIAAAVSTIGTGTGIAGAAAAMAGAASAAAGGAGFTAAVAAGVTSAVAPGLAVAAGGAAALAGGSLSLGSIALELVALVGVAQSVHQHQKAKSEAARARRDARDLNVSEKLQATDEAARQNKVLAEEKVQNTLASARQEGEAANLQNRSSMQIATITREIQRQKQGQDAITDAKVQALNNDVLTQYRRSDLKKGIAFKQNKGPSKLALGLSLGSSLLGSVGGIVGGTLGKAGQLVAQTAGTLPPMLEN